MGEVPICPACGAKFSHSRVQQWCVRCKLPDEIAAMGPRMIARWKKQQAKQPGVTKAEAKKIIHKHPGTRFKRRKKHGIPKR